ncbi:MAG: cupin domain-containing protein [Sandaracinaceae bacterium]|nr:cupin domain-containing protein [Sandaracinaceae bacterium]
MELRKGPGDARTALFGGEGTVTVYNLLTRAAPPFSAVLACELEPGGSVGRHVQQRDPELVLGLEGDGEATVDDTPWPLGPGDLVYLAHGQVLSIANRSREAPLRYLIIKALATTPRGS